MTPLFSLLQLCDSAFPSGGFAHSGGLEAALQRGEVARASLPGFVAIAVRQAGRGMLPFVTSAHEAPARWPALDEACELFLRGHVQNRASRELGRGLLEAAGRALPEAAPLLARVRATGMAAHHAPAFGAVFAALGFGRAETQAAYLHGALRSLLSAAVRLGAIGPLEAQRQHAELLPVLSEVAERCGALRAEEAAQTAPVLEVLAGTHERLYTRLFQS